MASIRKTKKEIRYSCGEVASELLIVSNAINDFDQDKATEIICEIATLQVDSLSKCNFDFDKQPKDFENKKEYRKARRKYTIKAFAKLSENIGKDMQAIIDKMNAAMPQHIKDALKK